MRRFGSQVFCWYCLLRTVGHADGIEEALKQVRDVKAEMYARELTVSGLLPSPAGLAEHQRRVRPVLRPERS